MRLICLFPIGSPFFLEKKEAFAEWKTRFEDGQRSFVGKTMRPWQTFASSLQELVQAYLFPVFPLPADRLQHMVVEVLNETYALKAATNKRQVAAIYLLKELRAVEVARSHWCRSVAWFCCSEH